jgi:hypothetical protein
MREWNGFLCLSSGAWAYNPLFCGHFYGCTFSKASGWISS